MPPLWLPWDSDLIKSILWCGLGAWCQLLSPTPNAACSGTFGHELVAALQGAKPLAVAHAAAVLADMLQDNPACKSKLLSIAPEDSGMHKGFLLHCAHQQLLRAVAKQQGNFWSMHPPDFLQLRASTAGSSSVFLQAWLS